MQGTNIGPLTSTVGQALKRLSGAAWGSASVSVRGDGQHGYLLISVILIMAVGSLIIPAALGYTSVSLRSTGDALDNAGEYYAADAAVLAVTADVLQGVDILDPGYTKPTVTLGGVTSAISLSAASTSSGPVVGPRYFDPRTNGALPPLFAGQDYTFQIDNVVPNTDFQINWGFSPPIRSWELTLFLGSGTTTGLIVATTSGEASPAGLTVPAAQIAGGTYTVDFQNTSSSTLASASFQANGGPKRTWINASARKDYVIVATAGGTTVAAHVRQGPGPTGPSNALPAVTIESWQRR